jgi:hypothetical protein
MIPELTRDEGQWSTWLCEKDKGLGVSNMVKLLVEVCLYLPLPFVDVE